ncbi:MULTISPECIES: CynX/NimT family MFS transporter [unclassified Streptomyces]|uniref:CynX/NimT family MFS transporter n=1 Tax=unclassified Streptomyces TaxID=2593676 RepID=UPI0022B6EA63|nr:MULTISPECIES: MFS transporter [unclassified Streptomyces]MCZ7413549.1 MFS transporter [Streptomyces sp. WMMC897]MCZ7430544.1 MFS transporter [Streptomyces sp. WMMC1477]
MSQDDRTTLDTPEPPLAALSTTVPAQNQASPPPPRPRSPWTPRLVVLGLVLASLNLRPAVAGLGPLLEEVRTALGMSGTVAGLLTSVPALCFAVFGGLAPRLARRHGPAAVVLAGMAAVTAGLALRPLADGTLLFLATTALALAGIAVSNVLMPVIVKRWFPHRVGAMTGLYSMALSLGTAAAAALTVPAAEALGGTWRLGLGMWAALAALALLPWAAVALRDRGTGRRGARIRDTAAPAPQPAQEAPVPRVTRSPIAWALGCFFGLQATAAYVTLGWLPQIYRDAGLSAATAGALLAVTMGLGIPLSFVLPRVAARLGHQGPLVVLLGLCGLSGYTGLWLAPASGAWAWALLMGVSNCAFPLVLTMIGMRSRTSGGVARLSAFVQSTGYLISIPGPLLVGALHGASGGWEVPLALLAVLMTVQIGVGLLAGRNRCIEDDVRVRD